MECQLHINFLRAMFTYGIKEIINTINCDFCLLPTHDQQQKVKHPQVSIYNYK